MSTLKNGEFGIDLDKEKILWTAGSLHSQGTKRSGLRGGDGGCDGGPVRYGQDLRCFQEGSGTGQKSESVGEGDILQENLLGFD